MREKTDFEFIVCRTDRQIFIAEPIIVGVALIAVLFQSIRAALGNPVTALRNE